MKENKFLIHANCIPVKGYGRSLICDLQNNNLTLIPNDLYEILKKFNGKNISAIKSHYKNKYDEIIDEYFDFLILKDLIMFTNNIETFPSLSLCWNDPVDINNCIIDFNQNTNFSINSIIDQLDAVGCKFIQMRFFKTIFFKDLIKINKYLEKIESSISSVEYIIPYHDEYTISHIADFQYKYPRSNSFIIYNSPNEVIQSDIHDKYKNVIYSGDNILSHIYCGVVSRNYFSINVKNFTESLKYNSCLNRKISIDVNGDIRNCPSMSQSFGNINNTTLKQVLNRKDFKKYWNITKDQVNICKDCEFRYICTDCRAYIENPEDKYSKPLKCGYSPYTNEWEEWSTNPLKQKAIEYYGMQDLVKKDA